MAVTVTPLHTSSAPFCPVHWPARGECTEACADQRKDLALVNQQLREYWNRATCVDCGVSIRRTSQRCPTCETYRRNRSRKSVAA